MNKTIYRMASLRMAPAWGNIIHTRAAESRLNIYAGTYSEQLKLSKSSSSRAQIKLKPVGETEATYQGTELLSFCRQF